MSDSNTLAELIDMIHEDEPLYGFFEALYHHEDAFRDETLLDAYNPKLSYYGQDITFPALDAVCFGILWEQQSPTGERSPETSHFESPRGFSSLAEIAAAQPDDEITAFFEDHVAFIEAGEHGEIDPVAVEHRGLNLGTSLRNCIVFGREWEAWYANGYAAAFPGELFSAQQRAE